MLSPANQRPRLTSRRSFGKSINRSSKIQRGFHLTFGGSFAYSNSRALAKRPRRLARSRTHAFHACNTGSNPVGVNQSRGFRSSWRPLPFEARAASHHLRRNGSSKTSTSRSLTTFVMAPHRAGSSRLSAGAARVQPEVGSSPTRGPGRSGRRRTRRRCRFPPVRRLPRPKICRPRSSVRTA